MPTIADLPVCILVFGMPGCPMCEEYTPRFERFAAMYGSCVPGYAIDCTDESNPQNTHVIDNVLNIKKTPTTVVLRYGRETIRRVGALTDDKIQKLFQRAAVGQECTLP